MNVNWFTVIAQILNFFLLVWLLKRFLYKPVLDAISAREDKIEGQIKDAETAKSAALKEQEAFKQKNDAFESEKKTRMDQIQAESKEEGFKLMETARSEANALKEQLEKSTKVQQENEQKALAQKIQEEVFAISRKTLTDLASANLEAQVTATFIERITDLKDEELEQFKSAFDVTTSPIVLKSAFPLSEKEQKQIENLVDQLLESKADYSYKLTPELIGGIELSTKEYKLSWSISSYLSSLEQNSTEQSNEKLKQQ
jgi:F-type H+-transporting ATPase subunit b